MSTVYKGDCEWRIVSYDRRGAAKDLPVTVQNWQGRADKLQDFLSSHPLGLAVAGGGFIHDRNTRDTAPKAEVDIIVAYAPDFIAAKIEPTQFSRSGTITGALSDGAIITGATEMVATRQIAYTAHGTRYSYFTSTMPLGPRYSASASGRNPVITREIIKLTYTEDGAVKERTYASYAAAPPAVRAAVRLPIVNVNTAHNASEIAGTPWFQCTDEAAKDFNFGSISGE